MLSQRSGDGALHIVRWTACAALMAPPCNHGMVQDSSNVSAFRARTVHVDALSLSGIAKAIATNPMSKAQSIDCGRTHTSTKRMYSSSTFKSDEVSKT